MRRRWRMEPTFNLVVGLAGPHGSGCSTLAAELVSVANDWPGCVAFNIKVADLISFWAERLLGLVLRPPAEVHARRQHLQNAGTRLRRVDEELVAKLISTRITLEADELGRSLSKKRPVNPPATLIFVVDSLKNVK